MVYNVPSFEVSPRSDTRSPSQWAVRIGQACTAFLVHSYIWLSMPFHALSSLLFAKTCLYRLSMPFHASFFLPWVRIPFYALWLHAVSCLWVGIPFMLAARCSLWVYPSRHGTWAALLADWLLNLCWECILSPFRGLQRI